MSGGCTHNPKLTNSIVPQDECLVAAVAVEDTSILLAIAQAISRDSIKLIKNETVSYNKHGPGVLRCALESFFIERSHQLSCIAISMPGTIDTENAAVIDIPRQEWDEARRRARGKPILDFRGLLGKLGYEGPLIVDNDTTMAALGERGFWGNDGGDFAYIRAGRGINAAVLVNGRPWHGALHPEMGHITVRRHERDDCENTCSFHPICLEGLVAAPAIKSRIEAGHDITSICDMVAHYVGQLCVMLTVVFAPPRIVIGSSLLREEPSLLERIRDAFEEMHGNYPNYAPFHAHDYIQAARGEASIASMHGALILAHEQVFSVSVRNVL